MSDLTNNDIAVLKHARDRAANGAFATGDDSPDHESCKKLESLGLMKYAGKYWGSCEYYVITREGRNHPCLTN